MKKSDLSILIREVLTEVTSCGSMTEVSPPDIPKSIHDKIIKQYGDTPKAYATMWAIHNKKNEGDQRVTEMWIAAEKRDLGENWNEPNAVHPSKKGMFKGKSKSELESELSKLKASGPHKKGSPEYTKEKELQFAIRAKSGWGSVGEVKTGEAAVSDPNSPMPGEEQVMGNNCSEYDESDMSNPAEKEEVKIGTEMVSLAQKLIDMHRPKV